MAEDYKKLEKIVPRRLGEYLTCSRGSNDKAIKKKLESKEKTDSNASVETKKEEEPKKKRFSLFKKKKKK